MYGMRGKKHPSWKGGLTPERQRFYSSQAWQRAKGKVWKRDNGTCQECGKKGIGHEWKNGEFHIHHIIPFADALDLRANPDNLVVLCNSCHWWVHGSGNVENKWKGGSDVGSG